MPAAWQGWREKGWTGFGAACGVSLKPLGWSRATRGTWPSSLLLLAFSLSRLRTRTITRAPLGLPLRRLIGRVCAIKLLTACEPCFDSLSLVVMSWWSDWRFMSSGGCRSIILFDEGNIVSRYRLVIYWWLFREHRVSEVSLCTDNWLYYNKMWVPTHESKISLVWIIQNNKRLNNALIVLKCLKQDLENSVCNLI